MKKHHNVDSTRTARLLGTEGTTKSGVGEENVDIGASEPILLIRHADVVQPDRLAIETCNAYKGRYKNGDHLTVEGYQRWNMDTVCGLEILSEAEDVIGSCIRSTRGISSQWRY